MNGRVRVSVVAGTRRVDLVVPDAVPLAELVPEFADPLVEDDVADLSVLTLAGTRLAADRGLVAQGVRDGDILTLAAAADEPPPVVYDDLSLAVRASLTDPAPRPPRGLLLGVGLVAVVTASGRMVGTPVWVAAFAMALVAVLVLPHATASWLVARTTPESGRPVDADAVAPLAARARHLLCEGRAAALMVLASATAVAGTTVWR